MKSILKQPLLQFLLGGFALFVLLSLVEGEPEDDTRKIIVTEPALLTFLQFQDKAFDDAQARALLASLDVDAMQRLIDDYVRDEIMVREAMSLGLDQNDDVIRQRLIQKIDFLYQGFADQMPAPDEAAQKTFYTENAERYQQPAAASFTHVFFSDRSRPDGESARDAAELLGKLNANQTPFEEAGQYGDRFLFQRNYVERSAQLIEDHFGPEMQGKIFDATPSDTWIGPFTSKYGSHLVLVRSLLAARTLTFEEVQGQVLDDMRRKQRNDVRRQSYEARAQAYSVDIQLSDR